ncbi:MAG: IclR family transcriptional regulator [Lentisphaerae bacterium]|nr:IclR family transcriptional regulator [Lentisphaerota bacterium]
MNTTLQNGFKLLELLAASGSEVSVTELSAQAALPPSNVCRLLKTLLQTGYVEQSAETRRYRISLKVLNLANARLVNLDFRRIGRPFAMQLAESLQAPTFLSQPLQGRSIIVDVAYPLGLVEDAGIVVGNIHSVFHSACGKICAAYATDEERARIFDELAAEGSPEPRKTRLAELAQIREKGLAIRDEDGILAIAAPLFQAGGRFCGALGAFLKRETVLDEHAVQELKRIAEALSFGLGYPLSQ